MPQSCTESLPEAKVRVTRPPWLRPGNSLLVPSRALLPFASHPHAVLSLALAGGALFPLPSPTQAPSPARAPLQQGGLERCLGSSPAYLGGPVGAGGWDLEHKNSRGWEMGRSPPPSPPPPPQAGGRRRRSRGRVKAVPLPRRV